MYKPNEVVETPTPFRTIDSRAWALQFHLVVVGDGRLRELLNANVDAVQSAFDCHFKEHDSATIVQRAALQAGSVIDLTIIMYLHSQQSASVIGAAMRDTKVFKSVQESRGSSSFSSC
jgi:hypothetical protein